MKSKLIFLILGLMAGFILFLDPLDIHSLDEMFRGQTKTEADGENLLYTCGMHPDIILDEPGICPICQMDLVPLMGEQQTEDRNHQNEMELYTCPMHPDILQEEPGECPVCGMDLVPLKEGGTGDGEGVEKGGRVEVRIDPSVVQKMNVTTEAVKRMDISKTFRTVGYLGYDQEKMVSVTTKYEGWIEKVHVNYLGQKIREGEPLFEVYSPALVQTEQELLSALAFHRKMENASPDARKRAKGLLEAARERLMYWDISKEQISALEKGNKVLRTLTVHSPISGLLMKRMKGLEGMAVRPGMELLHIADLSSLWLEVEIYENQLPWLHLDTLAEASFSYNPSELYQGRIRYIEPEVREETRTVTATLEIDNRRGKLRPGMYATVVFKPVTSEDVLVIPIQSVLRTGERDLAVIDLGGGRFIPREIRIGRSADGWIHVLEGVEEGEMIVTSSQFLIDSESNLLEAVQRLRKEKRSGGVSSASPKNPPGHQH